MSLRAFLNIFTASALLGGLAFWPAACASQRLFSQARSGEHASRIVSMADGTVPAGPSARAAQSDPGKPEPHTGGSRRQSAAGLTLWKDRGSERSFLAFSYQPDSLGEGSGASAQGANPDGEKAAWKADTQGRLKTGSALSLVQSTVKQASAGVASGPSLRSLATFTPWRRELVVAHHLCGVAIRRIAAIVARESGWNHRAVSTAGAKGLMQLMPPTARMMGVDDSFDPQQNLIGGACYYRMLLDRFKSHHRASVAFHRGPNAKGPTPQASHDYATDIIEASN